MLIRHSYPYIDEVALEAVRAQLLERQLAEGQRARELEVTLSEVYGYSHAVSAGSGCQALKLALRAQGVKSGSRVAMPTYVCPEVLGVLEDIGAVPVLGDIGEDCVLDPNDEALEPSNNLDAIVLVSPFGRIADANRFRQFGIPIVSDWAQVFPTRSNANDEVVVLSFEATKAICGGEGGAILTNSAKLHAMLEGQKLVRDTGYRLNLYPMSDLQASLVASQLSQVAAMRSRRLQLVELYNAEFASLAGIRFVTADNFGAMFRYVIRLSGTDRTIDSVIQKFADKGVSVRRPVSVLLHHIRNQSRDFPGAKRAFDELLSIPLYPALEDSQVEKIVTVTKQVLA